MVSLTRSSAILELGKRLVDELDVADDHLASWMAHFVAQRMKEAEAAPDHHARSIALDNCAKAILEIWRHRSSLPDGTRPLEDLEPVLRVLLSLDVDQTDYRYYRQALRKAATADVEGTSKQWLDLAIGLDYSARMLVQFALRSAAHNAASQADEWVELALQAGADSRHERAVVRFVLEGDDAGTVKAEGANTTKSALEDRAARLENFANLAAAMAAELRARLSSS